VGFGCHVATTRPGPLHCLHVDTPPPPFTPVRVMQNETVGMLDSEKHGLARCMPVSHLMSRSDSVMVVSELQHAIVYLGQ
jgi:hypothetical protein